LKKLIFIFFILSLCSCIKKKDWNCTCDVTGNYYGTYTKTIPHQTQNKANTECGDYGKELSGGSGGTYKCKLAGI
jgi:hypothetical protein